MLWSGVAAPLCVATSIIVSSLINPSVNLMRQSISLLSEGPHGFFERAGFVIGGTFIVAFAWTVRKLWPQAQSLARTQTAAGGALVVTGLAIQQGLAPTHGFRIPSPWGALTKMGVIHVVAAGVFFGALIVSCGTVAQGLLTNPQWRRPAAYSLFSGAAIALLLPAFVVTADLGGPAGALERLAGLVGALWEGWLALWLQGQTHRRYILS